MKIKWFLLVSLILFLSACGDTSVALTNDNGDIKEVNLTTEQQKVIDEYKKFNDEEKSDMVFYKYSKDFMGENSTIENHDEIKKEYSKAVGTLFFKDINNFYRSYNKQVDYSVLDDEIYTKIIENKEEVLSQLKSEIPILISNDRFQEIQDKKVYSLAEEDIELNAMLEYASALHQLSKGANVTSLTIYLGVSPDYKGMYSDEISNLVSLGYVTDEVWREHYNKYNGIVTTNSESIPITLGLTDQEVLYKTSWGKPKIINKTETINFVREQWVYPNNNYLYFEDGYLTSIQSSR